MESIKVTDYGIFTDAINNIKDLTTNINQDLDAISNSINTLDEESFLGPIKDQFSIGYNSSKSYINGSMNFFINTESAVLEQISEAYKDADKVNADRVGSV